MSFTPNDGSTASSIHLVLRSLLQHDSLPFVDALTSEHIQEAFDAEGVSFGNPDSEPPTESIDDGGIVYTMGVTLWAMLSQALFTDVQRSCRAAVQRVAVYYALSGGDVSSTNTGAYCRARAKIPEGVVQRLAEGVAERCEALIPAEELWMGFRTRVVDGTTFSMPDTKTNQAEYPQSSSQAPGLGFPVLRGVALTSLATAMVVALAVGPCVGKETGETALLRTLFDKLGPGDLVLSDRLYCGWFMLALMQERGVEFVTRLHQLRTADFSQGKRLGREDHIVTWDKPAKPEWLDQETYDRLPDQLTVREVNIRINVPGCRTASLVVVTSLLDHKRFPRDEIAALYRRRWGIELELRDIKVTMRLDVLRRKTPAAVRQELWTGILTYNLIRQSMLQSARVGECRPDQLSFASALQLMANTWVLAAVPPIAAVSDRERLIALRILNGHCHRVGNRPDRVEPRAVKRRAKPIAWLKELRESARAKLVNGSRTQSS